MSKYPEVNLVEWKSHEYRKPCFDVSVTYDSADAYYSGQRLCSVTFYSNGEVRLQDRQPQGARRQAALLKIAKQLAKEHGENLDMWTRYNYGLIELSEGLAS